MTQPPRPEFYDGQDLGPHPHVALILGQEQIGAFVVATPLMRGLRERYPGIQIDYLGGEGTRQIEEASPLVDARHSLFGRDQGIEDLTEFFEKRVAEAGAYDLIVNLEADPLAAQAAALSHARYVAGKVLDADGVTRLPAAAGIDRLWHDTWNRPDLLSDYPELGSQFITEIFCRLTRVETKFSTYEVPIADPERETPDVLLATGASRSAKLWHPWSWLQVASWLLARGLNVGVLGAAPNAAKNYHSGDVDSQLIAMGVEDFRAPALTIPQVGGALARVQAFLTIDTGLMHIAAGVGAPTVAVFGASPRRIWVPDLPNLTVVEPDAPCTLCEGNRFQNEACLLPVHQCMESIPAEKVIAVLEPLLS